MDQPHPADFGRNAFPVDIGTQGQITGVIVAEQLQTVAEIRGNTPGKPLCLNLLTAPEKTDLLVIMIFRLGRTSALPVPEFKMRRMLADRLPEKIDGIPAVEFRVH